MAGVSTTQRTECLSNTGKWLEFARRKPIAHVKEHISLSKKRQKNNQVKMLVFDKIDRRECLSVYLYSARVALESFVGRELQFFRNHYESLVHNRGRAVL